MLKFEGWKTKVTIPRLFWLDESSAQAFCCFSFRMGGGGAILHLRRSDDAKLTVVGGARAWKCRKSFVVPGGVHSERECMGVSWWPR